MFHSQPASPPASPPAASPLLQATQFNAIGVLLQALGEDGAHFDLTEPNPNGQEFHNLYIDMNGLIHPCAHPEDGPAPKTEEEMLLRIWEAVDHIFSVVRPRRLVYLAIDGVAPRAKMNQQRSRRFKQALGSRLQKEAEMQACPVRADLEEMGFENLPPEKPKAWDSNVITPGTEFMDKVAKSLHFYIRKRISEEPAWSNLAVILSDSNDPGEGEHKIVEFIRQQRLQSGYDPNTHHVVHGLDADLIMLGLATHEPHFTLVRDHIDPKNPMSKGRPDKTKWAPGTSDFDFLHIATVREYLYAEFYPLQTNESLSFEYSFERCIEDFIFLCFFVGNDFLPHLPSLEIREGALDELIQRYRDVMPELDGYLTVNGNINMVLSSIVAEEEDVFKARMEKAAAFKRRGERTRAQHLREKEEKIQTLRAQAMEKELKDAGELLTVVL
eukprot:gene11576-2106_t